MTPLSRHGTEVRLAVRYPGRPLSVPAGHKPEQCLRTGMHRTGLPRHRMAGGIGQHDHQPVVQGVQVPGRHILSTLHCPPFFDVSF